MRSFELVIFDCDGVLVDSERPANEVFRQMLNELGLSLSLEDMFDHFVGLSLPQCMNVVAEMLGTAPPADFLQNLTQRTTAVLSTVQPVAGVPDLLHKIALPYCVASNGEPEHVRLSLQVANLLHHIGDRVFCASEVGRPKPAPDVYLHAAAAFNVLPSACAVVEDTPTGVQAGVSAGMHVFGFVGSTSEKRLREAGAHTIISEMAELEEHFGTRIELS